MRGPLRVQYVGQPCPPSLADSELAVTQVSCAAELEIENSHCVVAGADFGAVHDAVRDHAEGVPVIFDAIAGDASLVNGDGGPIDIVHTEAELAHRVQSYASQCRRRRQLRAERDRERALVERIPAGLLVVDENLRIRRANEEARALLGAAETPLVGTTLRDLFHQTESDTGTESVAVGELFGRVSLAAKGQRTTDHLWVETESESSCYGLSVTPREHDASYLVGLRDVTATKRREKQLRERENELERRTDELETQTAKLEYQNDRLDKFAGIVSHDLRNPLSVASGRLDLLAQAVEQADDPAVDREMIDQIEQAHSRMGDIIDEALTLAREGKAITETERTRLTERATQAWSNVETEEAELSLCEPVEIESDSDRLQTVFENLFRNSLEHGSTNPETLTVTVGLLEDGFYIEDTGLGIPEENREQVFEEGFTTDQSGTGFGLAIVRDIVRAHGWAVTVTDGTDGGARFEITGVSFALTSGDLIRRLAEPLGTKKATELVETALGELGAQQTRFDHETAQRVLEQIRRDHNGLVTVAAETAKRRLDTPNQQ